MGLLDQLWDDVVAGPQPERGLEQLKRPIVSPLDLKEVGGGSMSGPTSPGSPSASLSPSAAKRDNVWRSVFNPGSNLATKNIGTNYYDKPMPNSPTVYDWLYRAESRTEHR
ncbi:auxin-repressed 12.5 kDa protein-like isoform X4 [Andrographis paniculata]|uniref:auxin-repressed 12.5 kDa protein-like isoform X4 n=1 Tax=Andrographis paniculata TaxID=175694 RepID=UPI0021E869AD|nr:auxin-repressed 12.5 kDa protein-like isoform X4 [Andrographis paniculata]XP_051128781.1 auxin-repressed 12.5 kDa protein-like isoform X4 [Andrographis paniculata]